MHFCRSNGKYCTSIGQVLVKDAGQNQLHLPELDKITGVLYLSVPPLNSLSALQVAIKTLRMMGRFLGGKRNFNSGRLHHHHHHHHQQQQQQQHQQQQQQQQHQLHQQQQLYLPSNLLSSITANEMAIKLKFRMKC